MLVCGKNFKLKEIAQSKAASGGKKGKSGEMSRNHWKKMQNEHMHLLEIKIKSWKLSVVSI